MKNTETEYSVDSNLDDQSLVQQDLQARAAALDVAQSFCVSAPAGSGKTELLTQRVLALLATVDEPERIVAITFTRKAAAEMRQRLVKALEDGQRLNQGLLKPEEIDEHRQLTLSLAQAVIARSEALEWQLVYQSERLRIQTFDGLCNAIVNSEPMASQMGGGIKPTDQADALYQSAIDNYFLELATNQSDLAELLAYFHNRQYQVKNLLLNMLKLRDQWLPHVNLLVEEGGKAAADVNVWSQFAYMLDEIVKQGLRRVSECLAPCADQVLELLSHAADNLGKNRYADLKENAALHALKHMQFEQLPDCDVGQLGSWLAIADLLFTQQLSARQRVNKNQGFPAKKDLDAQAQQQNEARKKLLYELSDRLVSQPETIAAFENLRQLPEQGLQDRQSEILVLVSRCLQRLSAYLSLQFSETGSCDHAEIQAAALRTLAHSSHSGAASQAGATEYRWHRSVEHLLVDEFQDTSVIQFKLIEALTQHWDSDNSVNRSLFVVGDGMQSIYAFRNANVGLFLRARTQGIGCVKLTPLRLNQNFRSVAPIVDWVNALFSKTFPDTPDIGLGAVPFEQSIPPEVSGGNADASITFTAIVQSSAIEVLSERQHDVRSREAGKIIEYIRCRHERDPSGSIAVLVRSRSHAEYIVDALEQEKIAWQGVDLAKLAAREAVVDILSLYRATTNLADDIAWWSLLRGPWCGLSLSDLQSLHDHIESSPMHDGITDWLLESDAETIAGVASLSAEAIVRCSLVSSALQRFWRFRLAAPLRVVLEQLWRDLGGDRLVRAHVLAPYRPGIGAEPRDESAAAEAIFSLIEEFESERLASPGRVSLMSLEQRLEKLFASAPATAGNGGDGDASTSLTPVQIMTMHKSKGLEFDTVILPALDRDSGSSELPILLSREVLLDEGEGILMAPKQPSEMYAAGLRKHAFAREYGGGSDHQSVYDYLKYLAAKASDIEMERVFYVAATRARRHLYLGACLACKDSELQETPPSLSDLEKPRKGSLLHRGWKVLQSMQQNSFFSVDVDADSKIAEDFSAAHHEEEPPNIALRRWQHGTVSVLYDRLSANSDAPADGWLPTPALALAEQSENTRWRSVAGTVYHELMMRLVRDEIGDSRALWAKPGPAQHSFCQHLVAVCANAEEASLAVKEINLAAQLAVRAISNTLNGAQGGWLLDASHRERRAEQAIAWGDQAGIKESRIDLSFIDQEDCLWIIDFKLIEEAHGRDAEIIAQYQSQLQHYSALMRSQAVIYAGAGNIEAQRCALYLPLDDKLLILNEI